jgi:hypothetical protein
MQYLHVVSHVLLALLAVLLSSLVKQQLAQLALEEHTLLLLLPAVEPGSEYCFLSLLPSKLRWWEGFGMQCQTMHDCQRRRAR